MFTITPEHLRMGAPRCPAPEKWAAALNDAMMLTGLAADVDYIVEFLAQCAHESDQFTRLEENLNYSPDRLMAVWPKRFPTLAIAALYGGKPHALADFVYANRMGNGDVASGDGWNYRGRGPIMITGLDAYRAMSKRIGDPLLITCPDRLCTASTGAMAAAAWWMDRPELNRLAQDLPDDDDTSDTMSISRIVNGGSTGMAQRLKLRDAFNRALKSTT